MDDEKPIVLDPFQNHESIESARECDLCYNFALKQLFERLDKKEPFKKP